MPKTKLLYLTDSYLKEATAKVVKVEKGSGKTAILILNQTIFYPIGGGQPGDKGMITGPKGALNVTSVRLDDQTVLHQGKLQGTFSKGEQVTLTLDWATRYPHMQSHTAGHLLDEAVKHILPEHFGTKGNHGIDNQYYIDFKGFIDQTYQIQIENVVNELVTANLPIVSKFVTLKDIEAENIVLPFKLPENKPLRLISIGDFPPVPDGGTQLATTGESWPITLSDFEYLNGSTRIHYLIQPSSLNEPHQKKSLPQESTSPHDLQNQINAIEIGIPTLPQDQDTKTKYLGKKGIVNQLAKTIPSLSPQEKKEAGQSLNQLKNKLLSHFNAHPVQPHDKSWLDVTAPGVLPQLGHQHLITQAINEISDIFKEIGFVRRRYPEIETDWYYAEGLNIPKDHPARDDQETFYLKDGHVLTAHTSNGQLHEMELVKTPPIKMINIGKTYRRQASNTHSPMFHQFEGLLIDVGISMTHLVGVSNYFAKRYFGPDREIRLRPHHFQFTEPSFEVDINCHLCKGRGEIKGKPCKVCKSGWLELGGAGMVHPNVLKNGGINPEKYSGFAFGWGVERVILMKHHVTDNLRDLYTQDLRFLQQG
jgi:phenylalanyl-tRNA synthetase alpha chain